MTEAQGSGSNGAGSGGAAPPPADITWYIARDGQQHGPLTDAEMRLFVEGGHLKPTDLLWRPGFPDWRPALQVFPPRQPEPKPPPPPPPPAQPQRAAPVASPETAAASQPGAAKSASAAVAAATQAARAPGPGFAGGPAAAAGPAARTQPTVNPAAGPATGEPHWRQQPWPQPANPDPRTEPRHPRPDAGRPDPAAQVLGADPRTVPTGQPQPAQRATTGPAQQAMVPVGAADEFAYEPLEDERPRWKAIVIGVLLIVVLAAGAWYVIENKSTVMDRLGISPSASEVPVIKADRGGQPDKVEAPVARAAAPLAQMASNDPSLVAAPRPPQPDSAAMDMSLQRRPLWTFMKSRFPDWYGERVNEAAVMVAAERPPREVTKHLVDALVDYRRKNADAALKASTERHRAIAMAFLDNLQALAGRSPDMCYSFISQGETSGVIVDLLNTGDASETLERQAIAIFEAVDEGQKQPVAHERPKKEDYDVLASQLGKLGWSQADLQMFADPKALSAATPARVCQMVRDWFKAHTEIADGAVQKRLLFETLRPVVGG